MRKINRTQNFRRKATHFADSSLRYDAHKDRMLFRVHGTVLPIVWKRCLISFLVTCWLCLVWDRVRKLDKLSEEELLILDSSVVSLEIIDRRKYDKLIYHLILDAEVLFKTLTTLLLLSFLASIMLQCSIDGGNCGISCGIVMGKSIDTAVMISAWISCPEYDSTVSGAHKELKGKGKKEIFNLDTNFSAILILHMR